MTPARVPLAFLPPIMPRGARSDELVLESREARYREEVREFAGVGRRAHRGDRRHVPPLPYARQAALRPGNPLLGGAVAKGFLAVAQNLGLGEDAVGAIAAFSAGGEDEEGALGQWTLFEALNVPALSEMLFSRAETWLFEHAPGIVALAGPASVEPLTLPGLLVDGFDAWPAALTPYNPPYYPELVEAEGYERGDEWSAWTLSCASGDTPKGDADAAKGATWAEARDAYGSYGPAGIPGLDAWLAHLADAAPFPAHPHLRWLLARAFRRAICLRAGPGVAFGIPDFAPALRLTGGRLFPAGYPLFLLALARARRLRVFPVAAPELAAREGIELLYRSLARAAAQRGYRELVIAPVWDADEKSAAALMNLGARIAQRFALYRKEL